jgi:tetratricopeptide (TPR) repeat protein
VAQPPERSPEEWCNIGGDWSCRELEAQGDRASDTNQAAVLYQKACGLVNECAGAGAHPCDPSHRDGWGVYGQACRKLAEIYWDSRALDPAYEARASLYWRRGCEAQHPDAGACRPHELDPHARQMLPTVASPAATTAREAFEVGRNAYYQGKYAVAAAAMRHAIALSSDSPEHQARISCLLGEIYRDAGDPAAALGAYEECLRAPPEQRRGEIEARLREVKALLGPGFRRPRKPPRGPLP